MIFKSLRVISLVCMAIFSCAASAEGVVLSKLWEISGFSNPESVIYDEKRDRLYVSNVNGGATDKDGLGSISIVSLDGEIIEPAWVSGLNAPKGLAIYENKLYVSDIDALVEIDIESGTVTKRYAVADAKFLNDVAASADGKIFVSDMALNRIHVLEGASFDIWLESPELESPNGLHAGRDSLIVGAWGVMTDGFATEVAGHLKQIGYQDKVVKSLGDGMPIGNLDGVEIDADGNYYVTDWFNGKLFYIYADGKVEKLLDLNQGSADHEYVADRGLILIPMMNDSTLQAYRIQP